MCCGSEGKRTIDRDAYGIAVKPDERMHDVLLNLHDVLDQAEDFSEFSEALLTNLRQLQSRFVNEFKQRFPSYDATGRAFR